MSELSLTPPDTSAANLDLVLTAPKAEEKITEDQAINLLPVIDDERSEALKAKAVSYIDSLAALSPKSPEFNEKMRSISSLAKNEINRATGESSRLLDRTSTSFAGAQKSGNSAQIRVAGSLADLRNTVDDLSPYAQGLKGFKKALDFVPGSKKLIKYFRKFDTSQDQLNAIIKSLAVGEDELSKDNIALEQEKTELWELMIELNEYAVLARSLDEAAVEKISELRSEGKQREATAVESDVLYPIRQRNQDILTQIAVSVQGYLAMDLVKKNNTELIKGVERARTTTISALKTAIVVASALNNQKLVLDQVENLNSTTSGLIASTSEELRLQTSRIHQQASSSTIDPQSLKTAFDNIFATMDMIDSFKTKANRELEATSQILTEQVARTGSYLTRAKEQKEIE
jgi:uncharacterized protein YaaN involved in tellurite resistance